MKQATQKPPHVCAIARTCKCYLLADEPNEDCPVHGFPDRRCDCGRFVTRSSREEEER